MSRASQQCARDWRLGASKAPSGEGVGFSREGDFAGGDEAEKRPMVRGVVYAMPRAAVDGWEEWRRERT